MNKEEEITERYLKSIGCKDIIFEPDGNIPPDFSIAGRIAVEVRRLNQHFFVESETKGLEEGRIPLFKLLQTSLGEFDVHYHGKSYWVAIWFCRPIPRAKTVRKEIHKSLTDFLYNQTPVSCKIAVTENMYLRVYPSEPVEGRVFRFAGGGDRESGGFVLSEFVKNFDHCMEEKTEKISDHYHKYSSWWLVLVDQIANGFDEGEKREVKEMVSVNSCWGKVIVLDSLTGNNILEI